MNPGPDQSAVDAANSAFWNELCGSAAARDLGITGNDPASLKKFDEWYFEFYPYLDKFINFHSLRNREVLEVGLGYGTVGQKIAESGARYTGLDIAQGPVDGLNHRLAQRGFPGRAIQGSILNHLSRREFRSSSRYRMLSPYRQPATRIGEHGEAAATGWPCHRHDLQCRQLRAHHP